MTPLQFNPRSFLQADAAAHPLRDEKHHLPSQALRPIPTPTPSQCLPLAAPPSVHAPAVHAGPSPGAPFAAPHAPAAASRAPASA
eukprot:219343-Chlamydomonas_euryale.AAC.1